MRVLAFVLTLAVASPAVAEIRQVILPRTPVGMQPCDGQSRALDTWSAPQAITIRRVETWVGTTGGNPFPAVDTYTTVFARRFSVTEVGPFVLSFLGLDHYVPFTGSHQLDKVFPADQAIPLAAGDQVVLEHMCNAVAGIPSTSHTQSIVTYTTN